MVASPYVVDAANEQESDLLPIGSILDGAIDRAERRARGEEKPVALPFLSLADHFGGGLWPGVHFVQSGTGIGKSALVIQWALHAALHGVPTLYVGLELEDLQIALRAVGELASVPWHALYTGKAGPAYIERARNAAPSLRDVPLFVEFGRPQGWPASELTRLTEKLRSRFPEDAQGAGSRPLLVVLDFLQIVGAETGETKAEPRERIGRAAYAARDCAARLNAAVVVVSSVARDKYGLHSIATSAGITYERDSQGRPIKRRLLHPDALVGLGKESGEIEYSADSVSVLVRMPGSETDAVDIIFATAKARASRATWSPLRFNGHRYEEPSDGGAAIVESLESAEGQRERAREEKAQAKEDAKVAKVVADASAIAAYVLAHPMCGVREARVHTVADTSARWAAAVALLGRALRCESDGRSKQLRIERSALPDEVASVVDATVERGESPPYTPPPSTSTVDGRRPTVECGQRGDSTVSTSSTVDSGPTNGRTLWDV